MGLHGDIGGVGGICSVAVDKVILELVFKRGDWLVDDLISVFLGLVDNKDSRKACSPGARVGGKETPCLSWGLNSPHSRAPGCFIKRISVARACLEMP